MRRLLLCTATLAFATVAAHATHPDVAALTLAREQAKAAEQRHRRLENAAARAESAAERAQVEGEALVERIAQAEAELTAAEARLAILERLRATQRARIAQEQAPVVRLTGALQTMSRRPPALAFVQPGSVRQVVHVRALLAATLPEIEQRTASLRAELARGDELRHRVALAHEALEASRAQLEARRAALARFEALQRSRSEELTGLALAESDRALAFGEEARALARQVGRREHQARLEARLAALPGPLPRPASGEGAADRPPDWPRYRLPVRGRVVTGVGEISDAGVHARGVTLETAPRAAVIAPAAGRVLHAGPFRGYGQVVILDHGRGWATVITDLDRLAVRVGNQVRRGERIGETGAGRPRVTVELRREGRPVPFAFFAEG